MVDNGCEGFVGNSKVTVAEKTWDDFERDFALRYVNCEKLNALPAKLLNAAQQNRQLVRATAH